MTQRNVLGKVARALAGLAALSGASALPAQITPVNYANLGGSEFVSFAGVTGGASPGTNYDNVLVIDGVAFGERFAGQTVTPSGNFDILGGMPTAGLTLLAGSGGQNLTVFQAPPGPVLSGNGYPGWPDPNSIGEGAVSLLFTSDQSEFGFRLAGGNAGTATIAFFRVDGSLIQSLALGNLPLTASYGFSRDGGVGDIRGISIWNTDVTGIGLSGFRHDVASGVPEPSTWAMMLGGFGLMGVVLRRRRRIERSTVAQLA